MRERQRQLLASSVSRPEAREQMAVPLYLCSVPAGFPSPAGDHVESQIDLNEWLVRNEPATFIVRVEGDSMETLIYSGDWLVVDCSLKPRHRDVVIAHLGGEVVVKRLLVEGGRVVLAAENLAYPPVEIDGSQELKVRGVVTYCIWRLR